MKITNKQNLPSPIIDGIKRDQKLYQQSYGEQIADISLTEMIAPPQIRVLKKKHADEIVADASDMLHAFFGSAVHAYLEFAAKSGTAEQRLFYTDLDTGMMLSGMFDLLEAGVLYDYKLMSVWSVINGVKSEHEEQLNSLCWLARKHDYQVDELKIVAMLKDWSASKAQYDSSYPQHQIMLMPVRMWSPAEQEKYIKERMLLHYEAERGSFVPECTDEERWASPAVFAVMKEGRKSAMPGGLKSTPEEAQAYINEHNDKTKLYIEERPRVYRRCDNYCDVAPFCEQYKGRESL